MQGLIPEGYSRFNIASGYAAFGDWWNKDGLTTRCRTKGRSISCALSRMKYRPAPGGCYIEDEQDLDVYLSLVERYYPSELEAERKAGLHRLYGEEEP